MEDEPLVSLTQSSSMPNVIPVTEMPTQDDPVSVSRKLPILGGLFSRLGNFIVALKTPLINISTWLGFSVMVALAPILASWLVSGVVTQSYSLEVTLEHGELLAISIGLMGEALGYLLTNPHANDLLKRFVGIGCTLVLLGSATLLGVLSVNQLHVDTKYVVRVSLVCFGFTLVIGCFCKWKDA